MSTSNVIKNQESLSNVGGESGVVKSCITTPDTPGTPPLSECASHFVTINIPSSNAWQIKRYKMVFDRKKLVEDKISYGDVGTDDQYKWLTFMLKRCQFDDILDKYYFWFELTKAENVHIHGLIKTKKKTHFEFKNRVYDVFGLPRKNYPRFMYIDIFHKEKWNNYDLKEINSLNNNDKIYIEKAKSQTNYKPYFNHPIRHNHQQFTGDLCGSAGKKCLANDNLDLNERPAKKGESNASHSVEGKDNISDLSAEHTQEQIRINKILTIIL